jgi:hypothetical protein
VRPKNFFRLLTLSSSHNKGIQAKKISIVNGETGHAANSRRPLRRTSSMLVYLFMVFGSWFMVHGLRFTVHGSRFMVHGSWFMVHGSWFMVHENAR